MNKYIRNTLMGLALTAAGYAVGNNTQSTEPQEPRGIVLEVEKGRSIPLYDSVEEITSPGRDHPAQYFATSGASMYVLDEQGKALGVVLNFDTPKEDAAEIFELEKRFTETRGQAIDTVVEGETQ
jgi:hypothetical protein